MEIYVNTRHMAKLNQLYGLDKGTVKEERIEQLLMTGRLESPHGGRRKGKQVFHSQRSKEETLLAMQTIFKFCGCSENGKWSARRTKVFKSGAIFIRVLENQFCQQ